MRSTIALLGIAIAIASSAARAHAQPTLGPFPDLRLDAVLIEARAAAEQDDPRRALGILERAAMRPFCPALVWDRDGAHSATDAVRSLPNPDSNAHWSIVSIPFFGAGGGLAIATGLVYAFDGVSVLGSRSPRSIDDGVYGALWGGAAVLIVSALVMLVHGSDLLNPAARDFERRRTALVERMRPPREARATDVFPAFGPSRCEPLTAARTASPATARADTRTSSVARTR